MSVVEEILRVCEGLPEEKQAEVADFARFLLTRQGDEAWERILAETGRLPRLEEFLRGSADEGDEPLDVSRLWSSVARLPSAKVTRSPGLGSGRTMNSTSCSADASAMVSPGVGGSGSRICPLEQPGQAGEAA